jgi:hypothetical protein
MYKKKERKKKTHGKIKPAGTLPSLAMPCAESSGSWRVEQMVWIRGPMKKLTTGDETTTTATTQRRHEQYNHVRDIKMVGKFKTKKRRSVFFEKNRVTRRKTKRGGKGEKTDLPRIFIISSKIRLVCHHKRTH